MIEDKTEEYVVYGDFGVIGRGKTKFAAELDASRKRNDCRRHQAVEDQDHLFWQIVDGNRGGHCNQMLTSTPMHAWVARRTEWEYDAYVYKRVGGRRVVITRKFAAYRHALNWARANVYRTNVYEKKTWLGRLLDYLCMFTGRE